MSSAQSWGYHQGKEGIFSLQLSASELVFSFWYSEDCNLGAGWEEKCLLGEQKCDNKPYKKIRNIHAHASITSISDAMPNRGDE